MQYLSTRSKETYIDSAQAVLNGLAPDGGLYVPAQLPEFDAAACLQEDTMAMATGSSAPCCRMFPTWISW